MTVLQLGAGLLWGILIISPIALAVAAGTNQERDEAVPLVFAAVALQVGTCIALYIAGGVRG